MTVIIGYAHEGKVYMGADSASNGGWETRQHVRKKVFRHQYLLIGSSGSHRVAQVIQNALKLPDKKRPNRSTADKFMLNDVVPAFYDCLKAHNLLDKHEREDSFPDGAFLVGCAGRLFTIWSNFALTEYMEPYTAIGAGSDYALGALEALWLVKDELDPDFAVRQALRISGKFCNGVCEPYYVEVLE